MLQIRAIVSLIASATVAPLFLLLEAKIAGVAKLFAIDDTRIATAGADLVVVYCRVQRLGFLQAPAADGGLQSIAREKALTALCAF